MPLFRQRATGCLGVLGALLCAALIAPTPAAAATPTLLYAAPTGSGSTCSVSAPCSLDGAKAKVQGLVSAMAADIDVYLRGGTYRLTQAFTLGPSDSGKNGHKVVYAAYPGEKPVLNGAKKITGFSLFDSAKNIYRAAVPAGTQSQQLFVDGVRAQRARGPLNPGGFTLSGSSFTTSDTSYTSFTNTSSVEVAYDKDWKHMRCPLASITAPSGGGSSLNIDPDCFVDNNTSVVNRGFPFNGAGLPKLDGLTWVENAYQLLDEPGEFYLDTAADAVYYKPRTGEDLSTADVELPVLDKLVDAGGTPGHLTPVNDDDSHATYTGAWSASTGRTFGDLQTDVHSTSTNGDSVSYTFTGTGLDVLSEVNSDEGGIDVYVDGTKTQSVSAAGSTRLAQQVVASVSGLPKAQHTVKLVKTSGSFMVIDGFTVIPDTMAPVHDITLQGLTFAYTTWNLPSTIGYIDNQAGVLWDAATQAPLRVPAAVQIHRGANISLLRNEIAHAGGSGVDLADGTQNSSVTGNFVHDISGGGVYAGEVDDYYLTDTARMTTGDTISQNWIEHVALDWRDAVGIWGGYTRDLTIANNDVGHTAYSGISVGWGWGYASACNLQAKQGLTECRHGTIYAGHSQILNNHVHDVMNVLHDGGPIYTNGGQGDGDGSVTSVVSGNLLEVTNHTNQVIYHDEGSSYWDTHDNVIRFGPGNWVGMWTPTIHDNYIHDNFADRSNWGSNATNTTVVQSTIVSGGAWPAAAQAIIAASGPTAAYRPMTGLIDDDDTAIAYTGSWSTSGYRGLGDFHDNVHAAGANGSTATLTFTGTGVSVIGEKYSDQGQIEVFVDGTSKGLFDTTSTTRQAQQAVYSTSGLSAGSHTIQVVKRSGSFATVDGFEVTGTYNNTDASIAYTGGWNRYANRGLGDYQDDVQATGVNGDSVTVTFNGTGIDVITETNTDEGTIAVSLDGVSQGTVNANAAGRHVQQTVYTVSGLPGGRHTLTLTKNSGTFMVIDRFDVK
ncbi:hypothetical protein ABZ960_00965 [Streptomyces pseudovenezuelae]|uniref:hypothetical protein n=1 Tax=Streptomyces pseudovenezuelae TaxID=67350 RepID=UPI0034A1D883